MNTKEMKRARDGLLGWSVVFGIGLGISLGLLGAWRFDGVIVKNLLFYVWMGAILSIVGLIGSFRNFSKLQKFIDYFESRQEPPVK